MDYKIDSELEHKIRENMQRLKEKSEQIHELHERISDYLNSPNPQSYKKITEILKEMSQVSTQYIQLIEEVQNDIEKRRAVWLNY